MPVVPEALRRPLDDLAQNETRAQSFAKTLSWEQLNQRPAARRWSILQCIEHLNITNRGIAAVVEQTLRGQPANYSPGERLRPTLLWRFFIGIVEPPVRLRAFAPQVLQPNSSLDPHLTLQAFQQGHAHLNELAALCDGLDLNRVKFRHPIIPLKISLGTSFLLIAAHERRHLWQADQVVSSIRPRPLQ